MNMNKILAGWVAETLVGEHERAVWMTPERAQNLRLYWQQLAEQQLNLVRIERLDSDDRPIICVTSEDRWVKQCFFDWGSYGTGLDIRETPELYGKPVDPRRVGDTAAWQWRLGEDELWNFVSLLKKQLHMKNEPAEKRTAEKLIELFTSMLKETTKG